MEWKLGRQQDNNLFVINNNALITYCLTILRVVD